MTALDPPPDDFGKLTLVTTEVAPASLLRLASARHLSDDPFRRSALYRFDAPDESFGVFYAAFDLETAFVESIVRARAHPLPAGEALLIDYVTLASRHVAAVCHRLAGVLESIGAQLVMPTHVLRSLIVIRILSLKHELARILRTVRISLRPTKRR